MEGGEWHKGGSVSYGFTESISQRVVEGDQSVKDEWEDLVNRVAMSVVGVCGKSAREMVGR